jgi:hypothetical protein
MRSWFMQPVHILIMLHTKAEYWRVAERDEVTGSLGLRLISHVVTRELSPCFYHTRLEKHIITN